MPIHFKVIFNKICDQISWFLTINCLAVTYLNECQYKTHISKFNK